MKKLVIILIVLISLLMRNNINAQNLGIGPDTFDPDPSAGVEMRFTNKGLLIPRVALTSTSSASPITSPANSLLVYNTASTGDVTPGYYYWNGSKWMRLLAIDDKPAWLLNGNAAAASDFIGTTNAIDFRIYTSNVERMTVEANGNVGIGTSTPAEKLHINGSIRGNQLGALRISTGNGYIDIGPKNTDWAHFFTDRSRYWFSTGLTIETGNIGSFDENLSLQTSGNTRVTILNSNGNVGIGTTTPAQKLHVEGNIRATSLASGVNGAIVRTNTNGDMAITNFTGSASDVLLGNGNFGSLINSVCYTLPNTGGTSQWVKLGTLTISQQGKSATFKVVSNTGYNANINQNFEVFIRFKTSNGSSINADGFAGDASYYVTGRNAQFFTNNRIKFVANAPGTAATAYDLYMYFGTYTGSASFYEVSVSNGTWTHSGIFASDPGPASSTVLIPIQEFNVGSGSLVVNSAGNVGIGTTFPTAKLHVAGNIKTNTINETSDARFKKNIQNIDTPLSKVLSLRGVYYYWDLDNPDVQEIDSSKQIGMIAQEVEKILPELVNTDSDGYKSVEYSRVVAVLIEAMKEQQKVIEQQNSILKDQERTIKEQKDMINNLNERLTKLEELIKIK
jgi:hypothetical protein